MVRLVDGMEVLAALYSDNGMPFVGLVELLNLQISTMRIQERKSI